MVVRSLFLPSWSWRANSSYRLGGKYLYLLSHLSGPSLEFLILMPLPPQCLFYRCVLPSLWGTRFLCMLSKHSTKWAMFSSPNFFIFIVPGIKSKPSTLPTEQFLQPYYLISLNNRLISDRIYRLPGFWIYLELIDLVMLFQDQSRNDLELGKVSWKSF